MHGFLPIWRYLSHPLRCSVYAVSVRRTLDVQRKPVKRIWDRLASADEPSDSFLALVALALLGLAILRFAT